MSDPSEIPPTPAPVLEKLQRPRTWVLVLLGILAVLYGGLRYCQHQVQGTGVFGIDRAAVRNELYRLSDAARAAQGDYLEYLGQLQKLAEGGVREGPLSDYTLLLTPNLAVHGPHSEVPLQDSYSLSGAGAPVPQVEVSKRRLFRFVALRMVKHQGKLEVWSIDQDRNLTRGEYELGR